MYLYKKTDVQNWDFQKPEQKHDVVVKRNGEERQDIDKDKIAYVVEEVAYWRKANAIHKWFIDNCAGGDEDCRECNVDVDDIKRLVDICKKLVKELKLKDGFISNGYTFDDKGMHKDLIEGKYITNPEIARDLLPTQAGFFFGSTDYDEWYIQTLKDTIEQLEPYTDIQDYYISFTYEASW